MTLLVPGRVFDCLCHEAIDLGSMASAKISITTRVVVESKSIMTCAKLHDEKATVRVVIDTALEKAAEKADRGIVFQSVEACDSASALDQRGTELETDDLPEYTVRDLRDSLGRFLKVQASWTAEDCSAPKSLHSALEHITRTQQQQQRALPTAPDGDRYDFRKSRSKTHQGSARGCRRIAACSVLTETTLSKGTGDRLCLLGAGPPGPPSVFSFLFSPARPPALTHGAVHRTRNQFRSAQEVRRLN